MTNNFKLCYNEREVEREEANGTGIIIFTLRRNLKLSQKELATRCGVTQQFIQRIEKGKVNPSLKTIIRIAAALNCTVDELIGKED